MRDNKQQPLTADEHIRKAADEKYGDYETNSLEGRICHSTFIQAVKSETARNFHAPKWISVEDALPLTFDPVLTLDSNKEMRVLQLEEYGMALEMEYGWCDIDRIYTVYKSITHWMPLPPIETE